VRADWSFALDSMLRFDLSERATMARNQRSLFMNQTLKEPSATAHDSASPKRNKRDAFAFHGVRYQVKDVSRSIAFYTGQLGFTLEMQHLPAFANVSLGDLNILLSGPAASGSRPLPDGRHQEPGGWNRVVLRATDLAARIDALKKTGVHFRNQMETGPGGKQIQLEDPDGNPIELFEPANRS
jgi:glyoxylase I family protein